MLTEIRVANKSRILKYQTKIINYTNNYNDRSCLAVCLNKFSNLSNKDDRQTQDNFSVHGDGVFRLRR